MTLFRRRFSLRVSGIFLDFPTARKTISRFVQRNEELQFNWFEIVVIKVTLDFEINLKTYFSVLTVMFISGLKNPNKKKH